MKQGICLLSVVLTILLTLSSSGVSAHDGEDFTTEELVSNNIKEIAPAANETHHIEVKPTSLDGKPIPYLKIFITAVDKISGSKETKELHPMYGKDLHYGTNLSLKPNQYQLYFVIEPPTFSREEEAKNKWISPIMADYTFNGATKLDKGLKIGEENTSDIKIEFEAEHIGPTYVLIDNDDQHTSASESSSTTQSLIKNITYPWNYIGVAILGFILGATAFKILNSKTKKSKKNK